MTMRLTHSGVVARACKCKSRRGRMVDALAGPLALRVFFVRASSGQGPDCVA